MARDAGAVHLIGVGGVMMSALAQVLHARGWRVTGSDRSAGPALDHLTGKGISVRAGHSPSNLPPGCDLVLASSAIQPGNVELERALALGLPVWDKGRMLRWLMEGRRAVGVAGTHGKTTTTAMIGHILASAGLDPLVLVGGYARCLGGNCRLGAGPLMVTETDESDGTFLRLAPEVAVVTNVDRDHLDYWGGFEGLLQGFQRYLELVPPSGLAVVSGDDPCLPSLAGSAGVPHLLYGLGAHNRLRAREVGLPLSGPAGSHFEVTLDGRPLGPVRLAVLGRHNVANSLAATGVALWAGVPWAVISGSLATFDGVRRRLEPKGRAQGVTVLDDYAHHPTEVRATLDALRPYAPGKVICVFQPHRYTRTRDTLFELGECFDLADQLILMDIYPAGEPPLPGISSGRILDLVGSKGPPALHIPDPGELVETLAGLVRPGDTVVTIGAGDVHQIADGLLRRLDLDPEPPAPPPPPG